MDFEGKMSACRELSSPGREFSDPSVLLLVISSLPMPILFDFAIAFPSVAHAWLRAVLVAIRAPTGI